MFVTWRLYGSLTARLSLKTGKEFAAWDRALIAGAKGPIWLSNPRVAKCVAAAFSYGDRELHLYDLHAWVILSNHVHVLWTPHEPLPEIMDRIKTFTAREANRILNRVDPFWQRESFDRWARTEDEFNRMIRYIEENPVVAGLCDKIEDWPWSSAHCDQ
jgi:putative DNA methylase